MRSTTLKLPATLLAQAKAYASAHGTTVTALVRAHLGALTGLGGVALAQLDPLLAFSQGEISRQEAVERLGLHDYASLLQVLGEAELPLPELPMHEIESQATTFVALWGRA